MNGVSWTTFTRGRASTDLNQELLGRRFSVYWARLPLQKDHRLYRPMLAKMECWLKTEELLKAPAVTIRQVRATTTYPSPHTHTRTPARPALQHVHVHVCHARWGEVAGRLRWFSFEQDARHSPVAGCKGGCPLHRCLDEGAPKGQGSGEASCCLLDMLFSVASVRERAKRLNVCVYAEWKRRACRP